MNENRFRVDTAHSPPPPPSVPGWPPQQPGPPGDGSPRQRRWPLITAAAVLGAVIASAGAAVITLQARDSHTPLSATASPVTVTVEAPPPVSPAPLPSAQADRQTCREGWIPAGNLAREAVRALQILPPDVKVGDPAIQGNPGWKAAVESAAKSYGEAGDVLDASIAAGTTPVLAAAAHTAVDALHLLGDAMSKGDPANGNAGELVEAAGGHVGLLCERLAP